MKFELNDKERDAFRFWDVMHLHQFHGGKEPYTGAIGGRVSFVVTDTSLGRILRAECGVCKRLGREETYYRVDLTDYEAW